MKNNLENTLHFIHGCILQYAFEHCQCPLLSLGLGLAANVFILFTIMYILLLKNNRETSQCGTLVYDFACNKQHHLLRQEQSEHQLFCRLHGVGRSNRNILSA